MWIMRSNHGDQQGQQVHQVQQEERVLQVRQDHLGL